MTEARYWLPSMAELRAIVRHYSTWTLGTGQAAPLGREDAEPDVALLGIVETPFSSIDDVYERLAAARDHLRERDDRRAVFLTVYTEMTAAVQAGISSGFFADPPWVTDYLVTFANYYRRALAAFEGRNVDAVAPPWRIGFGISSAGTGLVVQDALLGINAHINYDLPYTLYDVSIDPDRPAKRADHDRINGILQRLVDTVQASLVGVYSAAGVSSFDTLLGRFDERLAILGLAESRRFAWQNAAALTDSRSQWSRSYVDWRVRVVSTGAAYAVLGPHVDQSALSDLRAVEASKRPLDAFTAEFTRLVPVGPPGSWE